jgi:hypothetical protein
MAKTERIIRNIETDISMIEEEIELARKTIEEIDKQPNTKANVERRRSQVNNHVTKQRRKIELDEELQLKKEEEFNE